MKDIDPKELKQVYIQQVDHTTYDEINLVDLAKILVRRKKLVTNIIILFVGLATAVIFIKPHTYTFTTSIEIGAQLVDGDIQPLEPPQALLAKIENVFIPLTLKEQRLSNPDITKIYDIKANNPANSLIVIMQMQGNENEADIIKSLLQSINLKSIQNQSFLYDSINQYTVSRLNQAKAELQLLEDSNDNETEIAVQLGLIDTYASQLATLRNTREILPFTQSIEPTGPSRTLMLAIAIITSIFLGIFSAFVAEFVVKVKQTKQ